jgi:hypothetical protein
MVDFPYALGELGNTMNSSSHSLIDLLAERRDLYEQLGVLDKHFAFVQAGPAFEPPYGNAASMIEPIEGLEAEIDEVNRRIARFRGPIPDGLAFDLI